MSARGELGLRAVGGATLKLQAPAKINLGLRLTGLREDGYHLLESLFVPVGLMDDLMVESIEGPAGLELSVGVAPEAGLPESLAGVSAGPQNLVARAVAAYREVTGFDARLRVDLKKRIPAGAGLGGGSSDAAAMLRALVALEPGSRPEPPVLRALALDLGADIPFFLAPGPALVTGVGEEIEPINGLPGLFVVLANPGVSVATAEVFRASDARADSLTPSEPGSTMRAILARCRASGGWQEALGGLLQNDLQPAATGLCPPIGELVAQLSSFGTPLRRENARNSDHHLQHSAPLGVSMSGSGATVFSLHDRQQEAQAAADSLTAADPQRWVCVTQLITQHSGLVDGL